MPSWGFPRWCQKGLVLQPRPVGRREDVGAGGDVLQPRPVGHREDVGAGGDVLQPRPVGRREDVGAGSNVSSCDNLDDASEDRPPCCVEAEEVMQPTCQHGNWYVLQPRPGCSDDEQQKQVDVAYIAYKNSDAYFKIPALLTERMNRRLLHTPCSDRRQSSCVWCCQRNHSSGKQHSRHGRKTTWYCSICMTVPLCKVKRYNGMSCFVLFHEPHNLFDPCCVEAEEVMQPTCQHRNRYVLQPCPGRREDVGGGDGSSCDDASEDRPPVASLAAAAPPADSGDAEGGERRAVLNQSRSPIINIPQRSTRQRV